MTTTLITIGAFMLLCIAVIGYASVKANKVRDLRNFREGLMIGDLFQTADGRKFIVYSLDQENGKVRPGSRTLSFPWISINDCYPVED